MPDLIEWFQVLGDAARLRILRLLEREELGVGEIARVVQMPQSTVSRHLKLLHDAGLLSKRAEGTASLYRFSPAGIDDDARRLWDVARGRLEKSRAFHEDKARLESVLNERKTDSRSFFGRLGGEWDRLRRDLFGEAFTTDALLALVDPAWTVADLGCGTGNAAERIAPLVKRVIAIDREPAMLDAARQRLARLKNIEFRRGELERLPLKSGEADAATMFLVLHHVDDPREAVREAARAIAAGGVLMIVDMQSHDREAYRHTMGHKHLGFSEKDVKAWARHAGLRDARFIRLRPDTESRGPGLFVATMRK
jgi:SAM-dependent methyltransferase